jgi:hypothetical protein
MVMPVRRRGNKLERWKIALIKAMAADGRWPNDQDILAYFTRPTRSINHRAIAEIRTAAKHATVKAATAEELDAFVASWPEVGAETGLSLCGDELLIKAREGTQLSKCLATQRFDEIELTVRRKERTCRPVVRRCLGAASGVKMRNGRMACRTPTRRESVTGMARFEESRIAARATSGDAALFQLAARLRVAE